MSYILIVCVRVTCSFSFLFFFFFLATILISSILFCSFQSFSNQRHLMVFHSGLSNSKSPYVSPTLLSILTDLNNAVVCILLWPRKGSLMKTQTRILDKRLYYTRKIELHRKGKKSRTVRITPIVICPSGNEIYILITVRRVHYSKMGKVPTTYSFLSFSDFQFFHFFRTSWNRSECTNHNWYHCHLHSLVWLYSI